MMNVFYKNHLGESVNLHKHPYHLLTGDLLDYKWDVLSSGSHIAGFAKGIYEKTVRFEIFALRDEYVRALDKVFEVFEKDILAGEAGKLYVNEQYLNCYITESKKTDWEAGIMSVTDLTIMTDYPYWITEQEHIFRVTDGVSTGNKRYPLRYPYRYANGLSDVSFMNNHYGNTDFRLVVFGPVTNPSVFINEHLYQVNTVIEEGEYLTVDSARGTIIITQNNGRKVNAFNYRNKESDIFYKLSQGMSRVQWSGGFGFNLTLLQERSQPKCA